MFEIERLMSDDDNGIILHTRRRTAIRNVIESAPTLQQLAKYDRVREKFGKHWVNRKPACGVYNCFGMAFASRRTAVFDEGEVARILSDDDYKLISEPDVCPGDLLLYRDAIHGLVHVAVVTRREKREGMSDVLYALSKWDSTSGEDEHMMHSHPWVSSGFDLEFRFMREA